MADIFQTLDQPGADVVQALAERLEYRGTAPGFVAMRERCFDRRDLGGCGRVPDMRCGAGVVTRARAARSGLPAAR